MSTFQFLIFALACIGVHRVWNFEAIFTPLRTQLLKLPYTKFLLCHACNGFWICLALAALVTVADCPATSVFVNASAAYALVRGVLWVYQQLPFAEALLRPAPTQTLTTSASPGSPSPTAITNRLSVSVSAAAAPCKTCGEKREAMVQEHNANLAYERRVVLLTSLSSFDPSYSLTTVIIDQARMLANNPAWLVQIWVHIGTDLSKAPELPKNVSILPIIPAVIWRNDHLDPVTVALLTTTVRSNLIKLGNATVITHDLLFQASYVCFAAAIRQLATLPGFGWLHVCHSAASAHRPVGGDAVSFRTTLPYQHRLLCVNDADRPYLAAYYDTAVENVLVCPNARDIASFGNFDPVAGRLVRDYGLHLADVTQVYPVSATRLEAKGVTKILEIFGWLTKLGLSCRLVLATAHANGDREKETIVEYRKKAVAYGLPSEHLAITSEIFPEFGSAGLSAPSVRDLFSVSNLFVFPSISEACSLVLAEAAISGCLLVVNSSLHTVATHICPERNLSFPFGSVRSPGDRSSSERVAQHIKETLLSDSINCSRRAALRQFSYERVSLILRNAVKATPFIGPNAT